MHRPGLAAVLLAAGLAAQAPALTAETAVGVFANTLAGPPLHQAIPPSTPVVQEATAQVQGRFSSVSTSAWDQRGRIVVLEGGFDGTDLIDFGTAQSAAQSVAHSWTWTLSGPRNGELVGYGFALLDGPSGQFRIEVDVDADGSPEFVQQAAGLVNIRLRVDRPNGCVVRVRTFAHARNATQGMDGYSVTVELAWAGDGSVPAARFLPGDNWLNPCYVPRLWPGDLPAGRDHVLDFALSGAAPAAPVALLLGLQHAPLTLPGSACLLDFVPLVAVPATADAQGAATFGFRVPGPIRGSCLVQAVEVDTARSAVRSSQGWRVMFVD